MRIIGYCFCFAMLFLACGCSAGVDVEDSSIVAGIAIDRGNDGKQYKVTLEVVNMFSEGQEVFDASKILSNEGDTLFECMRNILAVGTKNLFFGHCRVLIIGEDLAREGIYDILHTMLHDDQIRLDTEILIAEGKAGDLLTKKSVTVPIRAYEMVNMVETISSDLGCTDHVQAYELFHIIETPGLDAMIPVFGIENPDDPTFQYRGNAVLKADRLQGYVNQAVGVYVRMVRNLLDGGVFRMELSDGTCLAPEIFSCKTRMEPQLRDGAFVLQLTVKLHVGIYEWDGYDEPNTSDEIAVVENMLAEYVQQTLLTTVQHVCGTYGNDVFGFGNAIYRKDPDGWRNLESASEQPLETVRLSADVAVDLRSSGRAGNLR